MKSLIILLLILNSLSSIYSLKYNIQKNVTLKKRFSKFNMDDIDTCQLAIDGHCIIDSYITESNIDETCEIQNSTKCKQLYDKGIESIEDCKNLPNELKNLVQKLFIFKYNVNKIICLKDEKDQYCPYSKAQFVGSNIKTDEEFKNTINDNCNSPQCTKLTIDYINDLKIAEEEFEKANLETAKNYNLQIVKYKKNKSKVYDEILEILNSEKCNLQYSKSSNANRMYSICVFNIHSFIWISLSLLIIFI